jgi:hypothetical protein
METVVEMVLAMVDEPPAEGAQVPFPASSMLQAVMILKLAMRQAPAQSCSRRSMSAATRMLGRMLLRRRRRCLRHQQQDHQRYQRDQQHQCQTNTYTQQTAPLLVRSH